LIFAIQVPSSYGALSSRGHASIVAIQGSSSYGALS
jgi:hypothetical protein